MLHLAGHEPAIQSALIIGGTFVLEDAATVLAAAAARTGVIGMSLALCSLYAGIMLGDVGLYLMGALSVRVPWVRRLIPQSRWRQGKLWLHDRVFRVVFISRFIPGARLPTYTACGALRADPIRFLGAVVVATLIWTTLLFGASFALGAFLLRYLGAWHWAGALVFAASVIVLGRWLGRIREARS